MLRRLARFFGRRPDRSDRGLERFSGLEALVETTPNLIGVVLDDRIAYVNRASRKLLGLRSRRELIGRPIWDLVHPEDRERARVTFAGVLASGKSDPSFHVRLTALDGSIIELEMWITRIRTRSRYGLVLHGGDTSSQRLTEASLRESEARYRLLAENSWDVVSEFSSSGELLWVSPSVERVLGYTPQQWAEKFHSIGELLHPDDVSPASALVENGELRPMIEIMQRIRHADGDYRWLETRGQSFTTPEGERHMVMTTRDVTEERRAHEAQRESEQRFQRLAQAVPVGIFRIDHRGRHVYLNERWSELTGIPIESALGTIGNRPLHPEDAGRILELSRKALAEGGPLILEQRIVRPDGEVRWVLNQALPEFHPDGSFAGWVGTLTDLSDKKASEQALAASEERLRLALEGADMCTWEWDGASGQVRWSPNAARIFGLRDVESMPATTESVMRLIHPDDVQAARDLAVDRTEKGENFELEFRLAPRADGETRWVLMRGHGIAAHPGRAVGVVAEVTLRRRLAAERAELEERLRESQRLESLGLLAGGVAHDFNNLLVGILGNAELALQRPVVDPGLRECLDEIQRAGDRAAGLVRQILAFAGRERIARESVDLRALVDDTLALLRGSIPARAKVDWIAPVAPACVEGDATQLRQVLMNLLTNACEALPPAGGNVAVRVTSGEMGDGDTWVTLEVKDSGCGVEGGSLAKIFDPFFTTKGAGRGLGLAVAHGIVRAHRGSVLVDSAPGRGTRMRVLLPGTPRAPSAGVERRPRHVPEPEAGRATVLVVDDERGVREVARRALERAGYSVLLAEGGRDALEAVRTHDVSAVLLDLTLAGESGEAVFAALREIVPATPVLAISGYAADHALRRLESQGIAGFVQKPFTASGLAASVAAAIAAQSR